MKFKIQVCCGVGFVVEELRSLVTECLDIENDEMVHHEQSVSEQFIDLNKSLQSISLNGSLLLTTEDLELIEQMEQGKASDIGSEVEDDDEFAPIVHVDEDEFLDRIENLSVVDGDKGSAQTELDPLISAGRLKQSSTANTSAGHDNNTQPFLFYKIYCSTPVMSASNTCRGEGR